MLLMGKCLMDVKLDLLSVSPILRTQTLTFWTTQKGNHVHLKKDWTLYLHEDLIQQLRVPNTRQLIRLLIVGLLLDNCEISTTNKNDAMVNSTWWCNSRHKMMMQYQPPRRCCKCGHHNEKHRRLPHVIRAVTSMKCTNGCHRQQWLAKWRRWKQST